MRAQRCAPEQPNNGGNPMRTLFAVAATLIALASPALAVEVTESTTLPYPVEKVWQQIGPFCNLGTWHPAVESCTLRR